ncbi:putative T7SS-secreted protein [Streptomyces albidus (ex Kaewkla and Franco 2022)]|uniref:putative T7SS-secreted protein n=1 Tax=Streptomyces albidus (ex Kaewkla and Franco 2022) TaxID=722709 RepID=UPI0015EE9EC1|nr:RHS repeat-associated core domain-containing protein [Streptomyces albidus (ex Kaewkla and Franco 2022)]
MGIGDFIPDPVEDFVEDGVEKVGEGVDEVSDWGADRLDDVGWESGADWVREKGDSLANALGADVDEMQLGETEDETKLVHGSVDKLRSTASHLTDFKRAFTNVGNGLKGLDSSHLKGEAADAFRAKVSVEPKKWFEAADACEDAGKALRDFAGTVDWAQKQAKEAIALYKKGTEASKAHKSKVDSYNSAVDSYNAKPEDERDPASLPDKPSSTDPGAADVKAAEEKLAEARSQRNSARTSAESAVGAARDKAPDKPSYGEQFKDGLTGMQLNASHFYGGIVKGTAGLVNFARSVNPTDPYNITHPAEYMTSLNSTTAGLVRMANDPVGTAKTMYDTFMKDPAEGTGRLIPELLGTKGLGAVKKVATVAKHVPDGKPPGRIDLDTNGPGMHSTPDGAKTQGVTDPVDLATGRMYLPQTDVALPGALALVFRRRAESGYRAGRWFGPSWSSTVDQRLEIDAKGVVLLAEDGLLLAYPHPAPGVPTLPECGPRMPLERTADGDYIVEDRDSGRTWHFTGPASGGDGEALLEQLSDRNGHRITFEYTPEGVPTGVFHSGGYHLKLTTEDGRVTALALAGAAAGGGDQVLKKYVYTGGDLTEVVDSCGRALRFEYDDEHRVIAWTDSNDRRYDYVYDDRDRCVAEGGTEGHVSVRIDYDGVDDRTGHRVTTVTNTAGRTTRYSIDDGCRVVAVTDPLGHTVRTEYDRGGRVVSRTDALGHTTRFGYDEVGRLERVSLPDGGESSSVHNELNLPVLFTDADGATWRQEYDSRGNRTSVTDPSGNSTTSGYDEHGHPAWVTDALGATTRIRCDAAGLPVEVTDPLGGATVYHRDAFGRPTAVVDPLGATARMEWTVEGKLARHTAPDGAEQTWEWDGEGNCVRHTDATGNVTWYEYTHFDRLAAETRHDGARFEFEHDAELRLRKVVNPQGAEWSYEYDPAGRLLSETDFDDRTLVYEHDANGRIVSRTNPLNETVSFVRDPGGRVIRKDVGGMLTTYAYDRAGRLVSASGPDAEVIFDRDRMGRVRTELVNGRALTHSYDAVGRPTRRITPSGAVSSSSYDAAGRRTALVASGRNLGFERDTAGRETGRRIEDSLALAQTFDPVGRLLTQHVTGPGAQTVQHRAYDYRPDGHLVGVRDRLDGSRHYDLDQEGRVTAVHARGWTETYAYDEAGNQAHATWPESVPGQEATGPRVYVGTRIATAGRVRYEHDAAGRIVRRLKSRLSKKPDVWRCTWDAEDRLTSLVTPDGTLWRYLYDPLGRRIAKQRLADDGATVVERVDFSWDGSTLVEQTTTAEGLPDPVTLTWDHEGGRPVAQTERITDEMTQREIDSRFFTIVTDMVGTPSELVDEHGGIAWRSRSTLWGTTTWTRDSTAYMPMRFPGQYFDPESGLHYNHYRYYDPQTARYASPDPLGLEAAPNPATYVPNPHAWTDPLGLAPCVPNSNPLPTQGTAPSFVTDANGAVQDVRHLGRPDNNLVFSGHGGIRAGDGTPVTVPEGTSVSMYSRHGEPISDALGNKIETQNPSRLEVYGPGEQLPNYSLFPPDGLKILGVPRNVTVTGETALSDLLRPNMGPVHWAACRSVM